MATEIMPIKTLNIQIQPGLLTDFEPENIIELLLPLAQDAALVQQLQISSGTDTGGELYFNVNFHTCDAPQLWRTIQSALCLTSTKKSPISRAIIVVCEGEDGWNDYLLLHHFDKSEPIDTFPSSQIPRS